MYDWGLFQNIYPFNEYPLPIDIIYLDKRMLIIISYTMQCIPYLSNPQYTINIMLFNEW